jgi:hypothetical protein
MAFTELERAANMKALSWFLEGRRPPEHVRPELDIGHAVNGHTVDLFEIRPDWRDKTTIRQTPVARVKFVRTTKRWQLYWMRSDLKWHAYEPAAVHRTLMSALTVIDIDEYGCFFG